MYRHRAIEPTALRIHREMSNLNPSRQTQAVTFGSAFSLEQRLKTQGDARAVSGAGLARATRRMQAMSCCADRSVLALPLVCREFLEPPERWFPVCEVNTRPYSRQDSAAKRRSSACCFQCSSASSRVQTRQPQSRSRGIELSSMGSSGGTRVSRKENRR
jgi:hypothetical protein